MRSQRYRTGPPGHSPDHGLIGDLVRPGRADGFPCPGVAGVVPGDLVRIVGAVVGEPGATVTDGAVVGSCVGVVVGSVGSGPVLLPDSPGVVSSESGASVARAGVGVLTGRGSERGRTWSGTGISGVFTLGPPSRLLINSTT
jgi:hypothetical protein